LGSTEPIGSRLSAGPAEVAKLLVDAGLIVLCSFISPYGAEREMVRRLVPDAEFIEIFVDTHIKECARCDPKGIYAKARLGRSRISPASPPR
jgi:bifunctional enzyme CysN/CysC